MGLILASLHGMTRRMCLQGRRCWGWQFYFKVEGATGKDCWVHWAHLPQLDGEKAVGNLDTVRGLSGLRPLQGATSTGIVEAELHVVEPIGHGGTG